MANSADVANDGLQREQESLSLATSHAFSAIYVREDGVLVSIGNLDRRLSECYDWLVEDASVDLEHGEWAFGNTSTNGSSTTKWNRPQMHAMLTVLLAHPIS